MANFDSNELIDWQEIWDNLDWHDEERQQETLQERLQQRAEQYAAPIKKDSGDIVEDGRVVLVFGLGSEQYTVDVTLVRGIRPLSKVTMVPAVPNFYRGVVNVRGEIISILDLRLFYDMAVQDGETLPEELIIVEAHGLKIGLLAHHVEGVTSVPVALVEPFADLRYTLGVTTAGLVLLDIPHLFEDPRIVVGGTED